jgi:hypothetical protein
MDATPLEKIPCRGGTARNGQKENEWRYLRAVSPNSSHHLGETTGRQRRSLSPDLSRSSHPYTKDFGKL